MRLAPFLLRPLRARNLWWDESALTCPDIFNLQVLQKEHLGLSVNNPIVNTIVRGELTRALPSITEPLWGEVQRTIPEFFGESREWKPINVNNAMLQIIAIVSGSVFVGPELGRSPVYLDASIQYTVDLFSTAGELRAWPQFLRPLAAKFFVPGVKKVLGYRESARDFLKPVIEERKRIRAAGEDEPNDVLQWMIAKSDKLGIKDVGDLADAQLMLSLGAIHTTTMGATNLFYDLAAHDPSIISALQAEIKTVLAEHDNKVTAQALQQMKLLDSVLRESQRLNTNSMAQFIRRVHKDTTLSDGTLLPAGTNIAVPTLGVSHDGEYYPNPNEFNPFRFAELREGKVADPLKFSNKEQYQFVSVTKENTNFGFGRHACPGRFFASAEIKLIMIKILLDYEFKMPDGLEGKRYPNITQVSQLIPDPTKEIMFRYVGKD